MKRRFLALALSVSMILMAGCGSKTEEAETLPASDILESAVETVETAEETVVETETETETEEGLAVIEEREVVDGKMQSYLTGEWVAEEIGTRRPIAVSIPNQKSCLPQYGITNASVIYQVPMRDNLTRLFCVFEDYDDLDRIGPVRSIRDYMVYTALEHDAFVCHWGSAYYADPLLNSDAVDNISQATAGIESPSPSAFDRYDRTGSYNSTDSAYMFIDGMKSAIEKKGYELDYADTFEPKFTFVADGYEADYAEAETVNKIWPGKEGNYNTVGAYFEYNPETQKYDYYEYGAPLIDERTGEQLSVDNVVLQVCYGEERDDHGYLIMEMHGPLTGDGTMYFFTRGKMVKGTWERMNGDDKPAKYLDAEGNELVFNQGKTFVCQIWNKWADSIEYSE